MPKGQRHLTHPGRCRIHATGRSGISDAAIARQLGRDRATVWRGKAWEYLAWKTPDAGTDSQ